MKPTFLIPDRAPPVAPRRAGQTSQTDSEHTSLFGFGGVTLDRLSGHQALSASLHGAYLVRLDVQLQGEEWLQGGRLFELCW